MTDNLWMLATIWLFIGTVVVGVSIHRAPRPRAAAIDWWEVPVAVVLFPWVLVLEAWAAYNRRGNR